MFSGGRAEILRELACNCSCFFLCNYMIYVSHNNIIELSADD